MIGGNDVYFGIPAATYRANLITIRDSLVNNGIECIHMLPTARTIVDERQLKNFIDTCSQFATDKKIDLFTLTLKSGTNYALADSYNSGDGVHPSNAGHTAIADYINARLREWGYDVIQGNQLRKIKIIVKNKPR
jgi:lysophospholipase L1-like esterase